MNRDQPFNDLPLLPPLVELETADILKKAITANRRLAELKGMVIVTTNDELYRAAADEKFIADPQQRFN